MKNANKTIDQAREAIQTFLIRKGCRILAEGFEADGTKADFVAEDNGLVFIGMTVEEGGEKIYDNTLTRQDFECIATAFLQEFNTPNMPVRMDGMTLKVMPNGRALLRHNKGFFEVADEQEEVAKAARSMASLLDDKCSAEYRRGVQDCLRKLGYGLAKEEDGYCLYKK